MQFQIKRDKWDVTFSFCLDVGRTGHIALPFEIEWWIGADIMGNKCREVSFSFLFFACHFEYWIWDYKVSIRNEV